MCAHNARLWNRRLIQRPSLKATDLPVPLVHLAGGRGDKIYPMIAITAYLLEQLGTDDQWTEGTAHLLQQFPVGCGRSLAETGTPEGWDHESLWREALDASSDSGRAGFGVGGMREDEV
jgi:abortive infection bacteriophage resistance protein